MTRDEITPVDERLLAALLAADALEVEGRAGNREPGPSDVIDPPDPSPAELSGLVALIRRLEHDDPTGMVIPDAPSVPPVLGRFEVIREIGQGGFGVVYLARDPALGRDVALKVPRAEVLITPDARRRFLREGRAAAGLDHPHIIPVFEAGEIGPFAYIVSAHCEGPTLSAWLRERTGPVPARMAARLMADLADAVQHAHDRGVLHRDLKPSNILLQRGDAPDAPIPRITDFGLARIIEEAATAEETRSGVPFGSPPYMAPEQAAGKRREIGAAADVYALGATLYEIVTRRPPFQGESYIETLGQVLTLEPVPPRTLRPGLPRDLETICLKCLEKDPARRYTSAATLREDLERFLEGVPIRARPISLRLRAAKWIRRRPMHALALVLAGLLASALVGGIVLRDALIQDHDRQLEREVVRADANALLARRHLQAFRLRQAQQAMEARQVERAQDILAAIRADRDRSDGRQDPGDPGFALHYLTRLARRDLVVLTDRRVERVNAIALADDGRTLATGDEDGTIRLRDPETGRVRMTLAEHRLPVGRFAFSPDGSRLVSIATPPTPPHLPGEVLLWDLVSARLLARLEGLADRHVADLQLDIRGQHFWELSSTENDGRRVGFWDVGADPARPRLRWSRATRASVLPATGTRAFVTLEGPGRQVVVHDIARGTDVGRTGPIEPAYDVAALSSDGRLLAMGRGAARKTSVWDVVTDREIARFDAPRGAIPWIGFSPDTRYLALNLTHGEFELRDLVTGAVRTVTPAVSEPYPDSSLTFSPDGRCLATNVSPVGNQQPTIVWQIDPWRQVAIYPGVPGGEPLFMQDGRSLIVRLGQAAIRWNYSQAPEPDQPAGHADEAWSLAFSSDGKTLASGSDDDDAETIKLWDVATGRLVRGWHAGRGTVAALAMDPRGRALASAHLAKPGEIRLWDPATGGCVGTLPGHTDYVRTIAFSPDGTLLASGGSDRSIRLWDVASRRCVRVLSGHAKIVRQVAFSPDGSLLASASNDYTVRLWDTATGRLGHTLREVEDIAAVAFAPDGRSLAAADEKGMVSIWDVSTGTRIHSMAVEHDFPLCLTYSPDGRSLAVAGKNRTIRLWDPATGQELLKLDGHKGQVNGLAFSPDGTVLASCSHDGAVRLWRSVP